jgi:hypothetical protein
MPIRYKYRMPLDEDYKVAWVKLAIYLAVIAAILLLGHRIKFNSAWEGLGAVILFQSIVMCLDSILMMIGSKVSPVYPSSLNYLLPLQEPSGALMIIDLIVLVVP